jgi:hypothetical protein
METYKDPRRRFSARERFAVLEQARQLARDLAVRSAVKREQDAILRAE